MKCAINILDSIYSVLKDAVSCPVHKIEKPLNEKESEYIVVNTLEVPKGELQLVEMNVNVHVADLDTQRRIPNFTRLLDLQEDVETALNNFQNEFMLLSLKWDLPFTEEKLAEHFINLRYEVSILNND